MKVERPNPSDLTPEEKAHLEKLRKMVQDALADGKVSQNEIQAIRALIHADHKVTVEELRTLHETTQELLGDAILEFEWD